MITVSPQTIEDIRQSQLAFEMAAEALSAGGGLEGLFAEAILQLGRFVAGNIEVDTGRTKNSVFPSVEGRGNSIVAMLGTNVSYSPFVRDAGHSRRFFEYAADVEGPRALAVLGDEVVLEIARGFN